MTIAQRIIARALIRDFQILIKVAHKHFFKSLNPDTVSLDFLLCWFVSQKRLMDQFDILFLKKHRTIPCLFGVCLYLLWVCDCCFRLWYSNMFSVLALV